MGLDPAPFPGSAYRWRSVARKEASDFKDWMVVELPGSLDRKRPQFPHGGGGRNRCS
ncbi:MAG: hypothetical protein INR71_09630 [Terriglobus roseus]|nr:hypothetical protein [Terriglobus roseus]